MPSLNTVVDRYGKQKYLGISLFIYLIVDAFFPGNDLLTYSILALMIITGPLATGRSSRERNVTIGLALLMVLFGYWSTYSSEVLTRLLPNLAGAAFFFALIYLISRALLVEQKQVTGETLWAAINVYLLLGMLFAFLYNIVTIVEPGAISGGMLDTRPASGDQAFLYYSFVTMTTLGYGDILPKIQIAAALAYVQALIGQLYVAILIARLVSMYNAPAAEE